MKVRILLILAGFLTVPAPSTDRIQSSVVAQSRGVIKDEYTDLVDAVKHTPVSEIKSRARYAGQPLKFDNELSHIQNRVAWMKAACDKHRDRWLAENKELNASG